MIGIILFTVSLFSGLGVWIGGIRPYLCRHGGGGITGATLWVSAWADWQQCSDLARAKKDSKASALSKMFLLAQVGFVVGIVLAICGI